jgi:hypothetical protein
MNLHFTEHARQRLAKRRLNPDMVEPDREDPELEHRLGFLPELDNRILRVIVSKNEPIRVITAFLDHSMKGKL